MTPGELWHAMPLWVWPLFEGGWPDGLLEWMVAVGLVVLAGLAAWLVRAPLAAVLFRAAGGARAGAGACGRRVRCRWNSRRRARPARRVRGRGR